MVKRLAIFTHVEHQQKNGEYFAYAPYIREMKLWFKHVEELEIVAPVSQNIETSESYLHEQISFNSVPGFNLLSLGSIISTALKLPVVFIKTFAAMNRANHLHLRCPGNMGLVAAVCQIFFPNKSKSAKYAGNWDPNAKQPWSYKLQKWILKNPLLTRNMKVLVYGDWPEQTGNIRPFFTASFSEAEIRNVKEKTFDTSFTFLFIGNLVAGKRPFEAIQLVQSLKESGSIVNLEIYGNGPEREILENYCLANNLQEYVKFHGSRSLEDLKTAYQKSHFVILPSRSEGWPKAIAEGMFYGCIPIATPVSCVPWMLDHGNRGFLLTDKVNSQKPKAKSSIEWSVGSEQGSKDIGEIMRMMEDPEEMMSMSKAAREWSQQYTLEKFESAIEEVLNNSNQKSVSPIKSR